MQVFLFKMGGRFRGLLLAVLIGALCRQSMAVTTAIDDAMDKLSKNCLKCAPYYSIFKSLHTSQGQCASSFTDCVQKDKNCKSLPGFRTFTDLCTIGLAAEHLSNKCPHCDNDYTTFTTLPTAQDQCASGQHFTVCVQADSACNSLPEFRTFTHVCQDITTTPPTTTAGNSKAPSMVSFHRASAILPLLAAFVTFQG